VSSDGITKKKKGEKRRRTSVLQIRTFPETRDALAAAAAADERTMSQYVERLVVAHLREHGYLKDD